MPPRSSRLVDGPEKIGGYEVREPYPGEAAMFARQPNTAGMMTEDGKITFNPYSTLTPEQRQAVGLNEAARLHMKQNATKHTFVITPEQRRFFADMKSKGIVAESSDEDIRATLIGRILSGDPSAGNVTAEQRKAAEDVARKMGLK